MRYKILAIILFIISNIISYGQGNKLDAINFDTIIRKYNNYICYSNITKDKSIEIENCYYNNGAKFRTSNFINGKINGIIESYFSSGKLMKIECFVYECPVGSFMEWYENGNLKTKGQFVLNTNNTTLEYYNPHSDTTLITNEVTGEIFKKVLSVECKGFKDGIWRFYNNNGLCIKEEVWEKGKFIEGKKHE